MWFVTEKLRKKNSKPWAKAPTKFHAPLAVTPEKNDKAEPPLIAAGSGVVDNWLNG